LSPSRLGLQAKDELAKTRTLFSKWIDQDETLGEAATLCDQASEAILQARIVEFESWVCRICLGAGGVKSKNPSKALGAKKKIFVDHGGIPCDHVHKDIWKIAKDTLGST
jgi:hypothetical protein